jgi:hypothetical protein
MEMIQDVAIELGNKTIAAHMELVQRPDEGATWWKNDGVRWLVAADSTAELNYHKDWNKLMPVVWKIAQTPLEENGHRDYPFYPRTFLMPNEDTGAAMVRFNWSGLVQDKEPIKAVWLAVVHWINGYNLLKEQ